MFIGWNVRSKIRSWNEGSDLYMNSKKCVFFMESQTSIAVIAASHNTHISRSRPSSTSNSASDERHTARSHGYYWRTSVCVCVCVVVCAGQLDIIWTAFLLAKGGARPAQPLQGNASWESASGVSKKRCKTHVPPVDAGSRVWVFRTV
jgi:hypothetical protein